jgi:DNA ligase-1
LGKAVDEDFGRMIGTERWFASRKLDGVRVLSLLDFFIPHDYASPVELDSVSFRSRTGNEFTSLARLEEQLRHLADYPGMRGLLQNEPEIIEEREDGVVKRLVLDGEVCHMIPSQGQTIRVGDDGTGASALWEDDGLVEDFQQAVSMVRRNETMDRPLYFVFDVLNWVEVASGGPVDSPGLGKSFRQRVEDTKELVGWLRDRIAKNEGEEPRVRAMIQREVKGKEDADAMVKWAMDEGWEGLIFRMDKPYKGRRS